MLGLQAARGRQPNEQAGARDALGIAQPAPASPSSSPTQVPALTASPSAAKTPITPAVRTP
jgi:hypothetical protein